MTTDTGKRLFVGTGLLFAGLVASPSDASTQGGALDGFARSHLATVQGLSLRDGVEYCGYYVIDEVGGFEATRPTRGDEDSCQTDDEPTGVEVVADWHTHGNYESMAGETPSSTDMEAAADDGLAGYVATPGGRIWLLEAGTGNAWQLCGPGCIPVDPTFRPCAAPPVRPGLQYTRASLAAYDRAAEAVDWECTTPD